MKILDKVETCDGKHVRITIPKEDLPLIEAAVELLEACKMVCQMDWEHVPLTHIKWQQVAEIISKCQWAISKAEKGE